MKYKLTFVLPGDAAIVRSIEAEDYEWKHDQDGKRAALVFYRGRGPDERWTLSYDVALRLEEE